MGGSVTFWFFFSGIRLIRTRMCLLEQKSKFIVLPDPSSRKVPKFGQFWSGLRNFSLDFALALAVSPVNTRESSSEHPKSINRQCGGGKSKYWVRFCIGGPCHVASWPRKVKIVTYLYLDANIPRTVWDRDLVAYIFSVYNYFLLLFQWIKMNIITH